jgi:hypothetical protein
MGMAIFSATAKAVTEVREVGHWAYANHGESFVDDINLYFSAYLDMPTAEGGTVRTVICRLIIPLDVARKIREQAGQAMSKGGH